MKRLFVTLIVLLSMHSMSEAAVQRAFYVDYSNGSDLNSGSLSSPFKTLSQAQTAVRTEISGGMTGDVVVNLRSGVHYLGSTLSLTSQDSGTGSTARVIYQAYNGEEAIVSGGQVVTTTWASAGNGIYVTDLGTISSSNPIFRQLYVQGQRAIKAREPDLDTSLDDNQFELISWVSGQARVNASDASGSNSWQRKNQIEMVVFKNWDVARLPILSTSTSGSVTTVDFQQPAKGLNNNQSNPLIKAGQRYYFENALEFLDQPGEWYLNEVTAQLYYKPRAGENINTVEVIRPILERLVSINGADHILFKGLQFSHSTWTYPSSISTNPSHNGGRQGYVGTQSGRFVNSSIRWVRSALRLEYTEDVRFERNTFKHLGGTGLELYRGTLRTEIEGNVFDDIGCNGILIYSIDNSPNPSTTNQCRQDVVRNNYFTAVGQEYHGASAIIATYANDLTIAHNEVAHVPYTGIATGFLAGSSTSNQDVLVEKNYVHDAMQLLDDGAAFYNHGETGGVTYSENFGTRVFLAPSAIGSLAVGLYMDNRTTNVTLEDNVIREVDDDIFLQGAVGNETLPENNTFLDTFYEDLAIENASGIQSTYNDIRPDPNELKPGLPLIPSEGLVAAWRMNNNGDDESGNSNDLSFPNGSSFSTDREEGTHSYNVNNTNQYCQFSSGGSSGFFNSSYAEKTLAMWIKTSDTSTLQTLYDQGDSSNGMGIRFNAGKLNIQARNNSQLLILNLDYPNDGEWHYLLLVYDNGQMRGYIDLDFIASTGIGPFTSVGASTDAGGMGNGVGSSIFGSSRPFKGKIDAVFVYDRVLSPIDWRKMYYVPDQPIGGGAPEEFPSLRGFWKMNQSSGTMVDDSTVNNNNGTLLNGATWTSGASANAISFDGQNDYVSVPTSPSLKITDSISVMAWFNHSSTGGGTLTGVEKRKGYRLLAVDKNSATSKYRFDLHKGGSAGWITLQTLQSYSNDQWHHVVGSFDGTTMRIYVDGILDRSISYNGSINPSNEPLEFGRRDGVAYYAGKIDDVRIYDRAVSQLEIDSIVDPFFADPDLSGFWMLDENSGISTDDDSLYNNDGTLQNGTSWVTGKIGSAVSFDGIDDYISVPSSSSLSPSDELSIIGWFKHSSSGGATYSGVEKRSSYRLLAVERNTASSKWRFDIRIPGGGWKTLTTLQSYSNNQWHHIAATYDQATMKIYVNGVLDRSTAYTSGITVNSLDLEIGRRDGGAEYAGEIDELYIYQVALPASEIVDNMNLAN